MHHANGVTSHALLIFVWPNQRRRHAKSEWCDVPRPMTHQMPDVKRVVSKHHLGELTLITSAFAEQPTSAQQATATLGSLDAISSLKEPVRQAEPPSSRPHHLAWRFHRLWQPGEYAGLKAGQHASKTESGMHSRADGNIGTSEGAWPLPPSEHCLEATQCCCALRNATM